MPTGYAALPNKPRSVHPEVERDLEDAFDDQDDDEQLESTPLTRTFHNASPTREGTMPPAPGVYDFERDYDYPPPGSPPRPSALALPNDFGNSNGQVPTSSVRQAPPRPSFFRRALGGILPTHYSPLASTDPSQRIGGGTDNDGVFANVTAKPARARTVVNENGDVHIVPEDSSKDAPPTYADAQADTVPAYWETTVHAPGLDSDFMVDDLPTGSLIIFAANIFTSYFFQFIGFLLTSLLATSHAAKYGSRAGLGLTLIQFGFWSRNGDSSGSGEVDNGGLVWVADPTLSEEPPLLSTTPDPVMPDTMAGVSSKEWLSFLLMTIGWFLLLSSCIGFWRVKHWESSIRASNRRSEVTPEDVDRDMTIRRNLEQVFGFASSRSGAQAAAAAPPASESPQDERMLRDLRQAGLI